jgi:hypothetical protein
MQMRMQAHRSHKAGRMSAAGFAAEDRDQIRRVQRSDSEATMVGGETSLSMRRAGKAGKAANEECEGSKAICSGATICAEDSARAGMGALRWQQGATGDESCGWTTP